MSTSAARTRASNGLADRVTTSRLLYNSFICYTTRYSIGNFICGINGTPSMKVAAIFVALLFITCFLSSVNSWRRRRRRRCKRDCIPTLWSSWSTCTKTCARGTQSRTRGISVPAVCGGAQCNHVKTETQFCNTQCCTVNCAWSWSSWGPCSGCGISNKTRTIKITQKPICGGVACPSETSIQTISCDTGVWVKTSTYTPIIVTNILSRYITRMLHVSKIHLYCISLSLFQTLWTTSLSLDHAQKRKRLF